MGPGDVVRSFFERMQARDWIGASELLDDEIRVDYTATGERFEGGAFLAMNAAYPDGWELEVVEIIESAHRVAAQVVVRQGAEVFWCAGFYSVQGRRIRAGVEHWVTERSEEPPEWRQQYASPRPAT